MFQSPVQPAAASAVAPLPNSQPLPGASWRERLAPRVVGIAVALLIELALLLLLLSLGVASPKKPEPVVVTVTTHDVEEKPPAPQPSATPAAQPRVQPQPQAAAAPAQRPRTAPVPVARPPAPPSPAAFIELPHDQLAQARISPRTAPAAPAGGAVYGPVDSGGGDPDTPRVGTAPNGEPMYAAKWYREPTHEELAGYLSTASLPAWGMIACKAVPDWRVEDCVGIDEYPQGSQMLRAILAAAWQFRVRPPRKGGEYRVGEWVRIRIDYYEAKRG